MSKTSHTPGPLRYYRDNNGRFHVCASGTDDLASLYHPAINLGTMEGNARLFAAAPDLLQELKNIANADTTEWDDPSEYEAWAKSRARFAIAKALGEQS